MKIKMINRFALALAGVALSGSAMTAEVAASFEYSSQYSIEDFVNQLPEGTPSLEVESLQGITVYDRSGRTTLAVSVDQTPDNTLRVLPEFTQSESANWKVNAPVVPASSKMTKAYAVPTKGVRIPVYYEGSKKVLDRVVGVSDGVIYFSKGEEKATSLSLYMPEHYFDTRLKTLSGTMSGRDLKYKESNSLQAATSGYVIEVTINSAAKDEFTVAPDHKMTSAYSDNISGRDGASGSDGYDGDGGMGHSSSAWGAAAGALGGGSGGDGDDGGNGRSGGDGRNGADGKDVGRVNISLAALSSPFYSRPLKKLTVDSYKGNKIRVFVEKQTININANGGDGGDGGDGGRGGDGGDGEAGSAGRKGQNATRYSSGGNGGRGGDGGNGGNGGSGGDGGDGGDGGRGGIVTVKVTGDGTFKSATRKSISVSVSGGSAGSAGSAGRGGSGGSAGSAGPGGPGGLPYSQLEFYDSDGDGINDSSTLHQNPGGSSGYSGSRGSSGRDGRGGSSGDSGSSGRSGSVSYI